MSPPAAPPRAGIGVIGGSGFYSFLEDGVPVAVPTPYGPPSERPVVGSVGGRSVAFIPRHGRDHRLPPHRVPYRANLWALRALGVRQVVAPCAVGSLRPELPAGSVVIPDQLVDRTSGRDQTYADSGVLHVEFADPYCPTGRKVMLSAADRAGVPVVDGGAMVVVEGPRFSTRAESRWFADQGWSMVNMTGHPEAVLARELAVCYTPVALVTDLDAGLSEGEGVSQEEVFRVFAENLERVRGLVAAAVPELPASRDCPCSRAHDGLETPFALPDQEVAR